MTPEKQEKTLEYKVSKLSMELVFEEKPHSLKNFEYIKTNTLNCL